MMRGKGSFFGKDIQELRGHIEAGTGPAGEGRIEPTPVEDAYEAAMVEWFDFGSRGACRSFSTVRRRRQSSSPSG